MADGVLEVARLTMAEFRDRVAEGRWLIIPSGTCEEHGPHLPLGSDTLEAEFLVRAVSERTGALVAPALTYGACTTTRNFPGTIDVRSETVEALTHDVIRAFAGHGCRKILVLSGHAGKSHMVALRQAALRAVEASPGLRGLVLCVTEIPATARPGPDDLRFRCCLGRSCCGSRLGGCPSHGVAQHPSVLSSCPAAPAVPDDAPPAQAGAIVKVVAGNTEAAEAPRQAMPMEEPPPP